MTTIQIAVDFTTKNTMLIHMQLYHTNHITIQSDTLIIHDPRLTSQLKRVMRARPGQQITIQSEQPDHTVRYLCEITIISDTQIETTIIQHSTYPHYTSAKHLIIAMSNKRDKMELIVQKAVECGVTNISIIPMHRSIIRQPNSNKLNRIHSIALEAVEQSRSTQLPQIQRHDNWDNLTPS